MAATIVTAVPCLLPKEIGGVNMQRGVFIKSNTSAPFSSLLFPLEGKRKWNGWKICPLFWCSEYSFCI